MKFFNRSKPDEFTAEMPKAPAVEDEYEDEEGYDEGEEGYEEDEDDEEDEAPRKDWVKTALIGTGLVAVLGLGTYYAVSMFAPDTLNALVNNLPFVSKSDNAMAPATTASGAVASKPGMAQDLTASGSAALAPPAALTPPPKLQPMAHPLAKPEHKAAPKKAIQHKAKKVPHAKAHPKKAWHARKPIKRHDSRLAARRHPANSHPRYRVYRGRYYSRLAKHHYRRLAHVPPTSKGAYVLQVGTFAQRANARRLVRNLRARGWHAYQIGDRVLVGHYRTPQAASHELHALQRAGVPAALTH